MGLEFSGVERRLDELCERLARLRALAERARAEFDADPYLRDIAERNLEVAAQCCLGIAHRIIAVESAQKPRSYYEAILRLGELGVLSAVFARSFASIAGFRSILAHEYLTVDWDEVYRRLEDLGDFEEFSEDVREWLAETFRA